MTTTERHCCRRLLAAVAIAAAGVGCGRPALAQAWEPVVVATAPAQDVDDQPPRRSLTRRISRQAAPVPPAPPASATPAPVSDGMPPLARIATQTLGATDAARTPVEPPTAEARAARDYCTNIADAAADARLAWQKRTLLELEQEIAKRLALLEEKSAELQKWLARRDEFSKKAQAVVVTIYARMRPDAAAAQLVAMDEETAAAVLTKLDPRNASAILNEMEATQAARLAATISGAANANLPGRRKQQAAEKKS
jgi:flagellar motility protein MotE (MotC chaperone)